MSARVPPPSPSASIPPAWTPPTERRRIIAIVGVVLGQPGRVVRLLLLRLLRALLRAGLLPQGDPTSQLLQTAGIFAVGFLMRPIGGWLFGRIADRFGRAPRWSSRC